MFENFFNTKKPIIGVDIGHSSIKVAQVESRGKKTSLFAISEISLETAPLQKDGIHDKDALVANIKKAIASAKPKPIKSKKVGTSLPASLVFTKLVSLPNVKKIDLNNAVPQLAEDFLPVPIEEVVLDWQIINENTTTKTMDVLVIAAPKALVSDLVLVFAAAGLELDFIEIKPISLARALTNPSENSTTALVDIGSDASGISIIERGNVKASSTIKFGAQNIAKILSTNVKATTDSAITTIESDKSPQNQAFSIDSLKPITDEVTKLIKYYRSRMGAQEEVKEIRICGGGAELKGISNYFLSLTNTPAILANPLLNINLCPKELLSPNLLKFSVAIGLSLRQTK